MPRVSLRHPRCTCRHTVWLIESGHCRLGGTVHRLPHTSLSLARARCQVEYWTTDTQIVCYTPPSPTLSTASVTIS